MSTPRPVVATSSIRQPIKQPRYDRFIVGFQRIRIWHRRDRLANNQRQRLPVLHLGIGQRTGVVHDGTG
jgi:hypothetical protein